MSRLLQRLGGFSARRPLAVLLTWLVLLAAMTGAAAALRRPPSTEFKFPGAQFQQVLDDLHQDYPEASGGHAAIIVRNPNGPITAQQRETIAKTLQSWRTSEGVRSVADPYEAEATVEKLQKAPARLESVAQLFDVVDAGQKPGATPEQQQQAQAVGTLLKIVQAGQAPTATPEQKQDALGATNLLGALQAGRRPDATPTEQQQAAQAQQAVKIIVAAQQPGATPQQQMQAKGALKQAAAAKPAEPQSGPMPQSAAAARAQADYYRRDLATLGDDRYVDKVGQTALVNVTFDKDMVNVPYEQRSHLMDEGKALTDAGLEVDYSREITTNISSLLGPSEVTGVIVAGIILLVMLGTLLAAGMPLAMALIGVGIGVGGTLAIGHWITLQSISPILALMLGLAVGIDYTLFILNRHRIQMLQGMEQKRSIARATGTAGNSVVFAGLTVFVALAALFVCGIPALTIVGFAAAATVAIAVLVAVTAGPATLSLLGHRVLSKRAWTKHGFTEKGEPVPGAAHLATDEEETQAASHSRSRWGERATRHPWLTILGVLAILGLMSVPVFSLRLGLPDGAAEPKDSTAYRTFQQAEASFGAGVNGPILVVGTLPQGQDDTTLMQTQLKTAEQLKALPNVTAVVPVAKGGENGLTGISADRKTAAWMVVPAEGPSAQSTLDLVNDIRGHEQSIKDASGVDVRLTGQTVGNIDVSKKLADALPIYLAVVVGLSLLVLLLVFRSILVPLIATGGFLLSLGAAMGSVVAIYQWGWAADLFKVSTPEPLLCVLPTIIIGVLFGLAMDYQMFLVSGMREAFAHGQDADRAVLTGFAHGRRVVTAAALIMASVFAGFVYADLAMIRPIGFGLAIGVLADAFLVRMTLTPAVMHLLGDKAWWLPRWLDKILPNVDVEGAALAETPAESAPAAAAPAGGATARG